MQKFVGELLQTINHEHGHLTVGMAPNLAEELLDHIPYAGPNDSDSVHIVISNLHDFLQAENPRIGF